MGGATFEIYDGVDPRSIPAYTYVEAAHYLRIPVSTLRAWARGQSSPRGEAYAFRPVLRLASEQTQLSFFNMVEAFVIDGLRRKHSFSLQRLRPAIDYLEKVSPSGTEHPLAQVDLAVFENDLFVEHLGELLNLTRGGQVAMRDVLVRYLQRVDRNPDTGVERLYPFVRRAESLEEPRIVVIDPRVSFGRPVIRGTGIPTAVVAERFLAGETLRDLSEDYGRDEAEIEEAIRCELDVAA